MSKQFIFSFTTEKILKFWNIKSLLTKVLFCAEDEISTLRESEEKLKIQQTEANRRENVLVMRLAAKEQEMQEYVVNVLAPLSTTMYACMFKLKDRFPRNHIKEI